MFDLVLKGGHVIDPSQDLDGRYDVAFKDGKVAAVDRSIDAPATTVRQVQGLTVTPGFIDMHTHVYWGATSISIRGDQIARRGGVTTMVDAGSAGPGNFPGLREHIIDRSERRIFAFLNVAYPGIFAYSKPVMVGECSDMKLLDPVECVRMVEAQRDVIVGIKVRIGRTASGNNGTMPLDMAIEVGEQTGLPVMAHVDHPPPSRRDVLDKLRPGDMLTHCFKPFPNTVVRANGDIWDDVLRARERGVIFDLGHGATSFCFDVARSMLERQFLPDTLSTDIHVLNVDGPVFDLMTTMGKFMALGVPLKDLVRCVTSNPAAVIGHPEIGSLRPGSLGDATVLTVASGDFAFSDCFGKVVKSNKSLRSHGVVCNGRWHDE